MSRFLSFRVIATLTSFVACFALPCKAIDDRGRRKYVIVFRASPTSASDMQMRNPREGSQLRSTLSPRLLPYIFSPPAHVGRLQSSPTPLFELVRFLACRVFFFVSPLPPLFPYLIFLGSAESVSASSEFSLTRFTFCAQVHCRSARYADAAMSANAA